MEKENILKISSVRNNKGPATSVTATCHTFHALDNTSSWDLKTICVTEILTVTHVL